jgi:hypothetical protein
VYNIDSSEVVPLKVLVWLFKLPFFTCHGFPDDKAITSESLMVKPSTEFEKPSVLLDDYSDDLVSYTHFQPQENKGRYLPIEILIS